MKILVTGASGFVGGTFWRAARSAGHEVFATGRRPMADSAYHAHDLVHPLPFNIRPEVVVHCAARSSPWGRRHEFVDQNITATRQVVDFCEAHGQPLLVHVSSAAVMYDHSHQLNLDESTPLPSRAINLYAESKRTAESLVRNYAGPSCIVRPRAVFGPNDTVIFPRILRAARAGRLPRIESSQVVLADLIYIDTLVEYLRRIAERRVTGLYLLTNNEPVPIYAFLDGIFDRLGLRRARRRVGAERALMAAGAVEALFRLLPFLGEPPITRFGVGVFAYSKTFNVAKALRDLGAPAISLRDGVDAFVRWQLSQTL